MKPPRLRQSVRPTGLFFFAPAATQRARMGVELTMGRCKPGAFCSWASIWDHTPARHQRRNRACAVYQGPNRWLVSCATIRRSWPARARPPRTSACRGPRAPTWPAPSGPCKFSPPLASAIGTHPRHQALAAKPRAGPLHPAYWPGRRQNPGSPAALARIGAGVDTVSKQGGLRVHPTVGPQRLPPQVVPNDLSVGPYR